MTDRELRRKLREVTKERDEARHESARYVRAMVRHGLEAHTTGWQDHDPPAFDWDDPKSWDCYDIATQMGQFFGVAVSPSVVREVWLTARKEAVLAGAARAAG